MRWYTCAHPHSSVLLFFRRNTISVCYRIAPGPRTGAVGWAQGRLEIFAATSSMPGWEGGNITVKQTSVGLDLVGSSLSNQGVIYLSINAIEPSPAEFNPPHRQI
jgi:hypothetical protein